MRKLFLITIASLALNISNAQTDSSKHKPLDCYVAGSLSMSTGDNFAASSYPSFEFGFCWKNMAFGLNTGRMSLEKSPYDGEQIENYYSEIKTNIYFPIGPIKGYVVTGWGQYYNSKHSFIEYGGGIVRSIGKFDLMLQVSSWNQCMYLSPGIAYNFSIK